MGNQSGNPSSVDFVQKDWQLTLSQSSQNQAKGNYRVLQNVISGQLIDEYQLVWNNEEDYRFYLDSYNWRKQQYNIVQSRYILVHNNQQFCSQSYAAKIYIEHIQTRLSDVTDIPHPDNLYVALATLEGYQKLYENVHHYFVIAEDQICVDKDGFVKVWVNSDLSKNYPETDLYANNDHKDQSHMVEQILSLIWENTDQESEPQSMSFRQFVTKKKGRKRIGFDQAKVIVNQYAKVASCQIPQKFVSILQMRDQSDKQNDTRYDQQEQQHYQAQQMEEQNQHYGQQNNSQFQNAQTYGQQPFYQQQGNFIGQNNGHINSPPTFYRMNSGSSSHFYHTRHQNVPPAHQITQQFMPQVLSNINRPIITIPPPTIGRFILPPGVQRISNQVGLQNRLQTQAIYQNLRNLNPRMNNENWQAQDNDRQLGYDFSGFNQNQGFEQRISTLNPQSGQHYSEEQRYSNQPNYPQQTQNYGYQFVNNQNIGRQNQAVFGGLVNRSLQLIKKSQKVINQAQLIRIGKSHIDGSSNVQMLAKNFPATYDDLSYNNSRHTASGHDAHHHRRQGTHNDHEQYECVDTKYYTIDTQIQLDQQIAADLKKYILAA